MKLPKSIYVIMDRGPNNGFEYGMDRVTPVTWNTRKGREKVYTSFALTTEQAEILKDRLMPLVMSYNELRALIERASMARTDNGPL
jgi:hypothetical protein